MVHDLWTLKSFTIMILLCSSVFRIHLSPDFSQHKFLNPLELHISIHNTVFCVLKSSLSFVSIFSYCPFFFYVRPLLLILLVFQTLNVHWKHMNEKSHFQKKDKYSIVKRLHLLWNVWQYHLRQCTDQILFTVTADVKGVILHCSNGFAWAQTDCSRGILFVLGGVVFLSFLFGPS